RDPRAARARGPASRVRRRRGRAPCALVGRGRCRARGGLPGGRGMRLVKSVLDRVLAAIATVLLSPLFAGLALWIVLESGRPVVFGQRRAGKAGVPFAMHKFRTMVPNAIELGRELNLSDDPFGLLPNDPRITRSGRFLRRTSLDELPQLWDVLRGKM